MTTTTKGARTQNKKFPEFDSGVWGRNCETIVERGVKAKFRQNGDMLAKLLGTGGATLAENSPHDRKCGIGVGPDDPDWRNVEAWTGSNLMGRILMEVREELGREMRLSPDGSIRIDPDYYRADVPEWLMRPGELNRIPQYHKAIHAYADTLSGHNLKNAFYYGHALAEYEGWMETNMGGGLPAAGFYEMKQDVYEIARAL